MNLPYDDSYLVEWDIIVPDDTKNRWTKMSRESKDFYFAKRNSSLLRGSVENLATQGWISKNKKV